MNKQAVDIIKFFFAFMICFAHTLASTGNGPQYSIFAHLCVEGFFVFSGYALAVENSRKTDKQVIRSTFMKLFIPCSIANLIAYLTEGHIFQVNVGALILLSSNAILCNTHLWYIVKLVFVKFVYSIIKPNENNIFKNLLCLLIACLLSEVLRFVNYDLYALRFPFSMIFGYVYYFYKDKIDVLIGKYFYMVFPLMYACYVQVCMPNVAIVSAITKYILFPALMLAIMSKCNEVQFKNSDVLARASFYIYLYHWITMRITIMLFNNMNTFIALFNALITSTLFVVYFLLKKKLKNRFIRAKIY